VTKKQESEEEEDVERSYSPSKYFGKRPSFEFKNLKSIEKPLLNRQFSEFKFREAKPEADKKVSKEAESYKVRFKGEEIIEPVDGENMVDSKTLEKKKASKPILKKAHFTDEIPIDNIFDKNYHQNLIDKIMAECHEHKKDFHDLLAKYFVEAWKMVEDNDAEAIKFLQVGFLEKI
jgi:hypothetical protein